MFPPKDRSAASSWEVFEQPAVAKRDTGSTPGGHCAGEPARAAFRSLQLCYSPAVAEKQDRQVQQPGSDLMIFDGVCHFCTRSVKFILDHESEPTLRFVPLQSPAGARMMRELGLAPEDARTFVLVVDGKPYVKSEAAIRVTRYLRRPWRLLGGSRVLPRVFRDWGYDVVARNRYRWFGRTESCMVPTPALRARFILE
jgi:predicted DCC family thiol-disulfide oxidoreductase YuxK